MQATSCRQPLQRRTSLTSRGIFQLSYSTSSCFARQVPRRPHHELGVPHQCVIPYQIFNQVNARSLTDEWNVYSLGGSSSLFVIILTIEAGLQAILVEFGGPFTKTTGLTPTHWAISIGMAAFTLPLGVAMRYIPVPPKLSDYASFYEEEFAVCNSMTGHSFLSCCLRLNCMPPLSTVAGTHGHTPLSPARRHGRGACLLGGPPN